MRIITMIAATALVAACGSVEKDMDTAPMGIAPDSGSSMPYSSSSMPRSGSRGMSTMSTLDTSLKEDLYNKFVAEVGDRVFFAYDSHSLNSEAQAALRRQAAWLRANPVQRVVIEGHCDERGTREYNLALGERRADAVRSFLASLGVPRQNMTVISYGKERPSMPDSNERAWSFNRRGVIVLR